MSVRSRVVLRCFRITDSYQISRVFSRQKLAILKYPFCCRPYDGTQLRQCPRMVFAFGLNRTQKKQNQAMHPSRRSADNLNHNFLAATWVIANVELNRFANRIQPRFSVRSAFDFSTCVLAQSQSHLPWCDNRIHHAIG